MGLKDQFKTTPRRLFFIGGLTFFLTHASLAAVEAVSMYYLNSTKSPQVIISRSKENIQSKGDLKKVLEQLNMPSSYYGGLMFLIGSDYTSRFFGNHERNPEAEYNRYSKLVILQDGSSTKKDPFISVQDLINEIGDHVYHHVLTKQEREQWTAYTYQLEATLFEILSHYQEQEYKPPYYGISNADEARLAEQLCIYTHIYRFDPGWFSEAKRRGLKPSEVFSQIFQDYYDPDKKATMSGRKAHERAYRITMEGFAKLEEILAYHKDEVEAEIDLVFAGHGNFHALYARNLNGTLKITVDYFADKVGLK